MRNAADLTVMAVPASYRQLGDFPGYYAGGLSAPYLTVFVGGNHEASSHLWELFYGGWVAPNIYYVGAANVLRFGPLRIAALSGIWKGYDYRKPHFERLPFDKDDVRSIYHVRELDVRKLLLLRTQVDIGMSHDWPRGIDRHGDVEQLLRKKPYFRAESTQGSLGNPAAAYVMDRLRPPYWFSAHLHVKYAAIKTYDDAAPSSGASSAGAEAASAAAQAKEANPDEIDLDLDDQGGGHDATTQEEQGEAREQGQGEAKEQSRGEAKEQEKPAETNKVAEQLRALLPLSFAPFASLTSTGGIPGQPVPPGITNKQVRFLALDKCLPGRHFLQLCEINPFDPHELSARPPKQQTPRWRLEYDPEWLAITRVFHPHLIIGETRQPTPEDLGEEHYLPLIDAERAWVEENVVSKGKLEVPDNFEITAPPHGPNMPCVAFDQPEEYTNPQTVAFCEMLGLGNLWDATAEERRRRRERAMPRSNPSRPRRRPRGRGGG